MTTLMLLLARRDGSEEIPFAQMAREYFGLEPEALEQKIKKGKIKFDFFNDQKKSMRRSNVALPQLALYIEQQRVAAVARLKEFTSE
ncbi:pyocin activator PrtN family protein [Epibacterium ulvae]|uniref:pyocin activator PrtN family protein n=1 Tax=Epibacterium ulvae TaxID=1156985 RepID=UPI002492F698|nr:pyocin activator PrtN family protein [Epibacterium ulvae]